MSEGILVSTVPNGPNGTLGSSDDPYLIEVLAPIESVTEAATLAAIRGAVPADRNTLELMSDALDAQAAAVTLQIKRQSLVAAIIFG